jgi:HTH-type transcriptional regulator / antitoxin HigA
LGIPAKVLLQGREATDLEESPIQWDKFPLREMVVRGWIEEKVEDYRSQAEDVLRRFFGQLGPSQLATALYRQSHQLRSARDMDEYALTAWTARAMMLARENAPKTEHKEGSVDLRFLRELARLSCLDEGPRLAQELLGKHGIAVVVEPHLPRTYLDGAAIIAEGERPIVALTLRYDRIDNFWFCLMHELAHVALHMGGDTTQFYDDLDVDSQGDRREKAADQLAGEALIPNETWRKSPVSDWPAPEAVRDLASELRIHPAIVAGRYRHEHRSYRVLNQFVGHGQVRRLFRDVKWD